MVHANNDQTNCQPASSALGRIGPAQPPTSNQPVCRPNP